MSVACRLRHPASQMRDSHASRTPVRCPGHLAWRWAGAHAGHSSGPTNAFQTGAGWVAAGVFFLYPLVSPGVMKVVCVCSAVRGHCGGQCSTRVFMFFDIPSRSRWCIGTTSRRNVIPLQSPHFNYEFGSGHRLTVHARDISPHHCRSTYS